MILERLQSKEGLSYTEQDIADYILQHENDIGYMTIQELAKETYTSNVTIIRLCRKLGCKGFREFKIILTKEIQNRHSNEYIDVNRPFYLGETPYRVVQSVQALNHQTIDDCFQSLNIDDLQKVSILVKNARRVFIYAIGDSSITSKKFVNRLIKLGILCVEATRHREEVPVSINTTSEDVALFITYGARSDSYDRCVNILKENNCPIITISSQVETYLTKQSDIHISFPGKEKIEDSIATFYSQICFDFILSSIYSLVYANTYSKSHEIKNRMDTYVYKSKKGKNPTQ